MRIGIDIRKYHDYGIGTYIQNLMNVYQHRDNLECVFFGNDELRSETIKLGKSSFISDNSPKYSLQELKSISKKVNSQQLDIFHSPHYTYPVGLKVPGVVTVHDIIHLRMKEYFTLPKRIYAYLMIHHACAASSAIIVDSAFGKEELLSIFRIPEKKIHIVPLGVDSTYFEILQENEVENVTRKYGITKSYILYTGSVKPHKNVPTLLKAFHTLRHRHNVQLVFTGERISDVPQLQKYVTENGLTDSVIDLGRIPRKELKAVYQSAHAVVLPSHYEGFGFSMLEAMASGVPAIGARATSITEVVGDAGLLFDPLDDSALTRHLDDILTNEPLRTSLIEKGTARAKQFSWEQCAERTINIYHEVLN
ncbi:MAG: glycosyltransferase family 1 protein [Bacteroidota bacterium]